MDSENPFGFLLGKPERKVAMDLAVVQASPLDPGVRTPQTLKVRINNWEPKVGELVLAIGYPELNLTELNEDSQRMLFQKGCTGRMAKFMRCILMA